MNIAIITGGSSGVGRSTAIELAKRHHGILLTYRTRAAEAAALVARIEAEGGRAVALPLDVGDTASLDGFVGRVREALRTTWQREDFDILVNNAGVGGGQAFGEVTEESFDRLFATNFKGPYFLTQKLVPHLRDGGQVLNVSSRSARDVITAGYSVYGATKAALTTVTQYWAKELAPRGIRVNSVSPGPILTNFGDGAFARHPEYIAPLAAQTMVGRLAESEDIGEAIAALLSPACRYMTAADIDLSGGFTI